MRAKTFHSRTRDHQLSTERSDSNTSATAKLCFGLFLSSNTKHIFGYKYKKEAKRERDKQIVLFLCKSVECKCRINIHQRK